MDIIKELVRVAREVVATIHIGDRYEVIKGVDDFKGREGVLAIFKIESDKLNVQTDWSGGSSRYWIDRKWFEEQLRSRNVVKTNKLTLDAPEDWHADHWIAFGKEHAKAIARIVGPIILRKAREAIRESVKPIETAISHGQIIEKAKKFSKYIHLGKEDLPKTWSGELERANSSSWGVGYMLEGAATQMGHAFTQFRDRKQVPVVIEGQTVMGEFEGEGELINQFSLNLKYTLVNEKEILEEVRKFEAPEQEAEIIKERRRALIDDISEGLVDETISVDNVKWSWDPGQRGGRTDPSWEAYVEEVDWKEPVNVIIDWLFFKTLPIDNLGMDSEEIYKKVIKGFGMFTLEDITVDFDELGTHSCKVIVKPVGVTFKGIEIMISGITPSENALEEAAAEYDEGRNEPDYDNDRD